MVPGSLWESEMQILENNLNSTNSNVSVTREARTTLSREHLTYVGDLADTMDDGRVDNMPDDYFLDGDF